MRINDINCGFATTFHSILSREKEDKGDTEMNVHGGEVKNAELDPEKERSLDPVGRMRRKLSVLNSVTVRRLLSMCKDI